ncbi:hypothetical protein [Yoonia sp. SDW83-1]|uniref:hypothetical protein n=1 Tax=Yoonia sp. SDW83-1 TaxID=3366945 RepID=UPI00398C7D39
MGFRLVMLIGLAACARAADPTPRFPVDDFAGNTSFPVDTQAIARQVALSEHQDILNSP